MKRKTRFQIGITILLVIGVVVFYQFRLRQYKGIEMVWVYQLKDGINIVKGNEVKESMLDYVQIDKNRVSEEYIKSPEELKDKVAIENLYEYDVLTKRKVKSKEDLGKEDERYDVLTSNDNFGGADIRPGDSVNIFMYDPLTQQYVIEAEDVEIIDVKNQDLISYVDSASITFIPHAIYFKKDDVAYKKMIDKSYNQLTRIRVSINGNRPQIEKNVIQKNNGILNN